MTDHEGILAGYEQHLARSPLRGHSPRTYLGAIRGFLAWLEDFQADGDPLADPAAWSWAVRDYRTHLVTVAKRAPATVNKHMAALDDFGTWRGLGKATVKRQEIPQKAPRALDPRAAVRYLRAVEACHSARDRAIALTPLYAGARIAEAARLDVDDVRLSARKGELRLIGKGEKTRTVPVHAKLREALAAWLAERPSWPGSQTPALFLGRRGTRLTTDAIGDVIEGIAHAAGLDDHVTAHVLRHTFGTSLEMSRVASDAIFGRSRERVLPAAQRTALGQARCHGSPRALRDLGCHHRLASGRTMLQPVRLHRMRA